MNVHALDQTSSPSEMKFSIYNEVQICINAVYDPPPPYRPLPFERNKYGRGMLPMKSTVGEFSRNPRSFKHPSIYQFGSN